MPGASARRIVGIADETFLAPFVQAGERLVTRGATLLTTSCGYLVIYQRALAARLPVPVATSALLLVPTLSALLPQAGGRVLTFSAASLSVAHLEARAPGPTRPAKGWSRAAYSSAPSSTAPTTTGTRRAERRPWPRRGASSRVTPTSGQLCSNVPTCRLTAPAIAAATGRPVHDLWSLLALVGAKRFDRDV